MTTYHSNRNTTVPDPTKAPRALKPHPYHPIEPNPVASEAWLRTWAEEHEGRWTRRGAKYLERELSDTRTAIILVGGVAK
jgi:hypothetical protein